jgi:hypothetical protein
MIMRRLVIVLAVLVFGLTRGAQGQMAPGGGGSFGGGGGFNIDPEMMQQLQENMDPELMQNMQGMMQIGMQVFSNMQEAGDDPMTLFQGIAQQMQDGSFDPDALQQQLVNAGYMTQDMVQQLQAIQSKMMGGVQRTLENTTYARIKQLLSPSDEEWNILRPRVKRVLDAQAEVAQGGETVNRGNSVLGLDANMGGMGQMMRGGFVSQMGGPQGSDSELGKAWKDLQSAVQNKQITEETLRARLTSWRTLHEKARDELKAAQQSLTEVLTLRQEAVMMMVGVL